MIDSICDKKLCTGCAACKNSCPKSAIMMVENEEGFLYPFVDNQLCVDCGLCKNVCPINAKQIDCDRIPFAYAVQCSEDKIRDKSSSGGVFSLIAEYIIDQGGFVFGAAFNDKYNVEHISCGIKDDLYKMQGSKYVQSDVGETFKESEQYLLNNKKVLFTGTPCQIGALRAYLKKDYPNLYTSDLICHGVPSPLVLRKYIEYREKIADSKVEHISFRDKRTGWKTYSVQFEFIDNTEYCKKLVEDPYMRIFLQDLSIRNSCYNCVFKTKHRQADITLADFWGLKEVVPEFDDDKGTSLVLLHSEKGQDLFDAIRSRIRIKRVDFSESIRKNPSIIKSAKKPVLRKQFFIDLKKLDFGKIAKKYCDNGLLSRTRRKVAEIFAKLGEKNER